MSYTPNQKTPVVTVVVPTVGSIVVSKVVKAMLNKAPLLNLQIILDLIIILRCLIIFFMKFELSFLNLIIGLLAGKFITPNTFCYRRTCILQ